jgi:DnaK suppressor protein
MPKATKSVATPSKPAAGSAPAKAATSRSASKSVAKPRSTSEPAAPAKRPAKSKPAVSAEPEAPVADKFLQEQRVLLLEERETYERQAESLRAEAEELASEMEPGDIQFDEESGEGGTLNVERERDLALSAQARAAVDEIDRALAKIDQGTYGVCEQCGEPIKRARLKALPYASLCIACKSGGLSRR